MKTAEQIRQELDAKIPRNAISQREGGNGVKLDYVSSFYVIARLNEVFGQGNWGYTVASRELVYSGELKRYNSTVFSVSYLADVRLSVRINDEWTLISDVGYGDGTDKSNPGKAHELAAKEAVTDALKRCAKSLGMSLGLALYDKTQENVEEETSNDSTTNTKAANPNPRAAVGAAKTDTSGHRQATRESLPKSPATESTPKVVTDTRVLKDTIKTAVRVLASKGTISVEDFKKKYTVNKVDELDDSSAIALYNKVKTEYPELKLN